MADEIRDGKVYRNGVLQTQSAPGTPGVSGAIGDAVAALAKAFAPKAITQRGKKVDDQINADSGTGTDSSLGSQF